MMNTRFACLCGLIIILCILSVRSTSFESRSVKYRPGTDHIIMLISHRWLALCTIFALISCATCRVVTDQPAVICDTFVSTWLQLSRSTQTAWPGLSDPSGIPGPPGYQTTVSRPATPSPRPTSIKAVLAVTAGQPFLFSLLTFIESPSGLVTAISTNPNVSWIQLDRVGKSISGQVPINYPAGRITVTVTTQYNIGGRNVDKRDFESQLVIVLDVFLPTITTTPGFVPTSTALTTVSRRSSSNSLPPITTSAQITVSLTSPWVTSTVNPPSSADPSTTAATSRVPAPTFTASLPFGIEIAPFLRLSSDTVFGLTTDPFYPWIELRNNNQLGGVVPASQPERAVEIILDVRTTNQGIYTVRFTAFIIPYVGPPPSPTSFPEPPSTAATTTAASSSRTRPTAVPTPTIYQGKSFTISKGPYELNEGDILNGVSSDPPTDWISLYLPNIFVSIFPLLLRFHGLYAL